MNCHVLITVGTTKFEKLIETASNEDVLDVLHSLGYTSVTFQTGKGNYKEVCHSKLQLVYERYFQNFEEEIEKADLIISHAGAGTCLEVLKRHKALIVVINEELMDNHQTELAEQLQENGYLCFCNCNSLKETLLSNKFNNLKQYPPSNTSVFSTYLDKCMGFV